MLTIKVQYEPQTPDRSFVGTIRPRIENDVGFRVSGKVAKRVVEVGQLVDARPAAGTARRSRPEAAGRTGRGRAARPPSGVLAQADASERRAIELRAKGWTTDVQMDQARAAADEARGRVTRAERSVELTRNNLSYATLTADARGVVTSTSAEPGQVVAAGQGVVRIARIAEKEVVVAVPETLVARAQGGEARVSLWSDPDKTYIAKLRELAPAADAATRTYLAKFSIPDATDDVKLGMTATLTLCRCRRPSASRACRCRRSTIRATAPALFVADEDRLRRAEAGHRQGLRDPRRPHHRAAWRTARASSRSACTSSTPAQKVRVVSSLSF